MAKIKKTVEITEEEARAFMSFFGNSTRSERKSFTHYDEADDKVLECLFDDLYKDF